MRELRSGHCFAGHSALVPRLDQPRCGHHLAAAVACVIVLLALHQSNVCIVSFAQSTDFGRNDLSDLLLSNYFHDEAGILLLFLHGLLVVGCMPELLEFVLLPS